MTAKHFIRLARALYSIRPSEIDHPRYETWWEAVRSTADVCEETNSRFNRTKFIRACEHGI